MACAQDLSRALATAAEPELSVTISAAHDSFRTGAEVKLEILLANLTDHQIEIGRFNHPDGPDIEYSFDVRDRQGRKVPLTRYRRSLHGTPGKRDDRHDCGDCSGSGQDLDPHEKTSDEIVISKIYDLRQPGTYTVQVSRPQGDESHMIVKSNLITLTITE